jgi:SAM-dependent methyltransferase
VIATHLDRIRDFYDNAATQATWFGRFYRALLAHYFRHIIPANASVLEVGCGSGELLAQLPNHDVTGVDISSRQIVAARKRLPHGRFVVSAAELMSRAGVLDRTFDYIILSETVNFSADVQALLENLQLFASRETRLVANFYNTLWHPFLSLATTVGLKSKQPSTNWLSAADVRSLLDLGNWELLYQEGRILCPVPLIGVDRLVNRFLAPLLPFLCLAIFQTARLRPLVGLRPGTVSVVIPARNEAGNIQAALLRVPLMGSRTEIIFVEGGSTDDTWSRIQAVVHERPDVDVKILQQTGRGKGNAVREGFAQATGDIFIILDADLTMPPEELPKFYNALISGRTEFANGVRLVYPMQGKAMRFMNMCANKFFSIAFSWVIGQPIKDTLCGTKALFHREYLRIAANRQVFGDFF